MAKFISFGIFVVSVVAFAESIIAVPDVNPLEAILSLLTNFKSMGPLAIASLSITIVVQSLKQFLPDSKAKKLAVLLLSLAYGVIAKIMLGTSWPEALVLVMLSGGGATAIYEWFVKPVMQKVEAPKEV
jgi:hypothetical protein